MSFGFTPHHSVEVGLDGLTPAQFLALCVNAAHGLDWDIKYISDAGLIAITTKKVLKRKQKVEIRISGDVARLRSESLGSEMMDWGRNQKNIEQFTALLAEGRAESTPEQLDQTYEEIRPTLVAPDQDFLSKPPASGGGASFLSLFIPREGYYVTPILVDINLAVFILMVVSGVSFIQPTVEDLIHWGANLRAVTLDGQWWRIITNFFVHIGIIHVAFNMYALLYIGVLLERRLGGLRFFVAYMLTGIAASVASLYWHPAVVSAGASGAIFGMYGVFLALLTTNLIEKNQRAPLLTSIAIFVGYNLLNGTKSGIDNAAHIGGLVSGMVIGYLFYPGLKNPDRPGFTYFALVVSALMVGVVVDVGFHKIPNDAAVYQRKIEAFIRLEKQALAVVQVPEGEWTPERIAAIRDTGIRDWNSGIRILSQVKDLQVSEPAKKAADALIRYCNWRILAYSYVYRRFTDPAAAHGEGGGSAGAGGASGEDSASYYNAQIKELLDSLNAP